MTNVTVKSSVKPQARFETLPVGTVFSWGPCTVWYVKCTSDAAYALGEKSSISEYSLRGISLTVVKLVEITPEA
jgi:hypothetical protein